MEKKLKNNEVHIWLIKYDSKKVFTVCSASTLSNEEVIKSNRFKRTQDGTVWAFFHTAVREILSRYVGFSAADIQFALDQKQKPYLKNKVELPLYFNLSHSGHIALLAVTNLAPIGVDIEIAKEIQDARNVASKFFSKQENLGLLKVNRDEFIQHFYQIWTAKEAVIKANGWGMSSPLDSFDVKVEHYAHWFSPILRPPIASTGVYWIKHLLLELNCCSAVCLNIIDEKSIQYFDINRVIVKEMIFENNYL
ncbi:4'-phosphopantetheinyl transferase superfamily protein [uncultured Paraglaciecola sp.]|uniref:4'-phosphopantetheinyl transferase family protein n=1 Tax=uncultured Paraglaciecola sp. TaxID=1765024 RepID=UPI002638C373|nr:4'-phosphopantetheinyl transferase superfamily protein [uncultured Paraglaciecola sp.]